MLKISLFIILFFLIEKNILCQNFNMSNGTQTTCYGNFYDSGGPSANYANAEKPIIPLIPKFHTFTYQIMLFVKK